MPPIAASANTSPVDVINAPTSLTNRSFPTFVPLPLSTHRFVNNHESFRLMSNILENCWISKSKKGSCNIFDSKIKRIRYRFSSKNLYVIYRLLKQYLSRKKIPYILLSSLHSYTLGHIIKHHCRILSYSHHLICFSHA